MYLSIARWCLIKFVQRPLAGFDKRSLEWLEKLFKQTVGNEKEIRREEFNKIVTSKNVGRRHKYFTFQISSSMFFFSRIYFFFYLKFYFVDFIIRNIRYTTPLIGYPLLLYLGTLPYISIVHSTSTINSIKWTVNLHMLSKYNRRYNFFSFQPFFTDRVFQIFDKDNSGTISLQEFLDAMHQFAGKSPDDKIKFLFKVYDIDGEVTWNIKRNFYQKVLFHFY